MSYDRKFIIWAFSYMILGLCLGIFMAGTQNHTQYVTHAHTLLVGFVVSFIYAVVHRLWLNNLVTMLSRVQYVLHQAGVVAMVIGLFLLYGGFLPLSILDPVLGLASLAVLAAAGIMFYLIVKSS